jgi:2-amino-4-hydroxy-6-hydroxymethyldihydropteridine diphosphokinase
VNERVFVALGANLGNRRAQLDEAVQRIGDLEGTSVLAVAAILETTALLPPDDPRPQPDFLNTVAELRTFMEPLPLLRALKTIESAMGRLTTTRWAPRVIDLDLVLFGSRQLATEELTLPHPGLRARRFVLEPLLALWPEAIDPLTGRRLHG